MAITVLGKTREKKIQSSSPLRKISHFYDFYVIKKNK